MKRVLVMGAGLVVKPLLDELLRRDDVELRLATVNIDRARQLVAGRTRATALHVNALDQESLVREVDGADLAISLLPANQHILIADACLESGTPLITTSYVSESFGALDSLARERGVLLLCECGLDPGIDHMTAAAETRRIHDEGGTVVSFASYCGGLPAPSANTNPWGYKFAWSPRGVVVATRNQTRYLQDGHIVSQRFPEYFASPRIVDVPGVGLLESYPNRDCVRYIRPYDLHHVRNFFRGTLRYPGWCETWHALHTLKLLDVSRVLSAGSTLSHFVSDVLPPGDGPLRQRVADQLGLSPGHPILERFEWLGLFSSDPVPADSASAVDVLVDLLQRKLGYGPGEHDMVVLEHHVEVDRADGSRCTRVMRLVEFGLAGDDSAMARTVSYPAALAASLILDGRVSLTGVQIPTSPELAEPILRGLEALGVRFSLSDTPAAA